MEEFIQKLQARRPQLVPIECSLGTVYMRRPTAEDRWRLLQVQAELSGKGVKRVPPVVIVAVALIKADGTPMFEDIGVGVDQLNAADGDDVDELYQKVLEVTGLGKRALEAAEKKSSGSQSSDSGTSSPST